jgi:hypothetical protein
LIAYLLQVAWGSQVIGDAAAVGPDVGGDDV